MAITPYLLYQDAGAALEWLSKAFGLRRCGTAYRDADGRVTHAEMKLGDAPLMLGSPGRDFKNPKRLGGATQNLYVDVDDVDRHYTRAVKAGATIIEDLKETFYGARRYGAQDLEGHQWFFAQQVSKKRTSAQTGRSKAARGARNTGRAGKRSSRK
jgi:uncharacterized glyoxalase superfamily protein PhnB